MALKPTVGRTVLVRSSDTFHTGKGRFEEVAGIVTSVSDSNRIGVMVMRDGHHSTPLGQVNVPHAQTDEEMGHHAISWRWMEFQRQDHEQRVAAGLPVNEGAEPPAPDGGSPAEA